MKVAYLAENPGRIDRAWAKDADGLMHHTGHNIGNLAFWYSARLLFDDEPHLVSRSTRAADVPRDVGLFVIPAANFLNKDADLSLLIRLIRGLDVPCLVLGLGAQAEREDRPPTLSASAAEFLREVAARVPTTLCLRGSFTEEVCRAQGIGNTTVLGCPSVLMNPAPRLGEAIERRIEALDAVASGPLAVHAACIKPNVVSVERELVRMAQLSPGSCYVVQRPVEMIKAGFGEALAPGEAEYYGRCAEFLGFGREPDRLTDFLRRHLLAPDSIDGWVHHLRRFSAAVNTRIHGTLMSLAAGIPGLCVVHDTRTRELARQLRVPHLEIQDFIAHRHSLRDLFAASGFRGAGFDEGRRAIAARYAEVVSAAGLTPSRHLRSFLDA